MKYFDLRFILPLSICIYLISCATSAPETSRYSKKSVEISKIVVVPLSIKPEAAGTISPAKENFLTNEIYNMMLDKIIGITIVSLWSSTDEFSTLREENPGLNYTELAVEVGKSFNADSVLVGTIVEFREREGGELGSASPASVAFSVELLSPNNGEKIWVSYFAETQETLFQNVTKIGKFFKRKGKWVSANQLAKEGVEEIVDSLVVFLGQS